MDYFFEKMEGIVSPPKALLPHGQLQQPSAPTPPKKRQPDEKAIETALVQKEITDMLTDFYRAHNTGKIRDAPAIAKYHLQITGSRDKCLEVLNGKLEKEYKAHLGMADDGGAADDIWSQLGRAHVAGDVASLAQH